jgi:hypothetical protein
MQEMLLTGRTGTSKNAGDTTYCTYRHSRECGDILTRGTDLAYGPETLDGRASNRSERHR